MRYRRPSFGRPFLDLSQLGKQRLDMLVQHGSVVELSGIDPQQENYIVEINMIDFGVEYWLYDNPTQPLDMDRLDNNVHLVVVRNAHLILHQGTPLRSKELLGCQMLQAHKVSVRW